MVILQMVVEPATPDFQATAPGRVIESRDPTKRVVFRASLEE
jgi:hypothetical protein